MSTPTPELDKQHAVIESGAAGTLGDFYDWLGENGYVIAKYVTYEGWREKQLAPAHAQPEQLLADFFGIDRDKIESERRAILEELRSK